MKAADLTRALKAEATRQGFELSGACPAVRPPGLDHFRQWLEAGYAGAMHYLGRRAEAHEHPRHVLEGARSIVMLGVNYRTVEAKEVRPGEGRVSCYAWGGDYHEWVHERLRALADHHRRLVPGAVVRGVVDTAPLLEREFARLAGLGWIGKNTLVLNRRLGSWFFLAALLTSAELEYDPPGEEAYCGSCRACLDACPTGALVAPYQLDARRCISYLTIELRESVADELRPAMGEWVFGCDVCQDVCPWNGRAPTSLNRSFQPTGAGGALELAGLFWLDDEVFRRRFRQTPLWRARRRGVLRNAAIALGNRPTEAGLAALVRGLDDGEAVVRGACAWALQQFGTQDAREALARRLAVEADAEVRREIAEALG